MTVAGPPAKPGDPFILRQSDISTWASCPLKYRYQYIDKYPRLQSGALTFGSIVHDVVMQLELTQDVEGAVALFKKYWNEPTLLDPSYKIDYYLRATNWQKYLTEGERMIRDWWEIIKWESDVILGREFSFDVPIGNGHVLHGTIDKLAVRQHPKHGRVLLVSDYKTNAKVPTYEWLEDNIQFTAYSYATTRPEFWANMPNGEHLFNDMKDLPRLGEWVSLKGPKRLDAGLRDQVQYNRLITAANAIADSVAMRIFVPTISGENCRWCDFRERCGLRVVGDDE